MSKNLTRKGLAIGAVVALGSTLIAGTPAFAADLVTLAPSAGTTYSTLLGQNFVLSSSIDLSIQAATANARILYKVTNASAATVALDFGTGSSSTAAGVATAASAAALDSANSASTSTAVFATSTNAATSFYAAPETDTVTGSGPSSYVHTYAAAADKTLVNNLNVSLSGATATTSVTVQAFIDSNGNGTLDTSDTASTARTVTFVKQSEVTATTVLTTPVLGATSLVGTVTLDKDINLQQITDSAITVAFKRNNAAYGTAQNATLNSDKDARVATLALGALSPTAIDAATYSAQAIINSANSGSASLKTAAAQTVSAVGQAKATLSANVAADGSNKWQARSGSTGAITFTSALTKADGTAVAAGITAHVVVTKVALDATSTITAGGKTFTSTSTATTAAFDVTTDASGNAVFTVTDSTGKVGDKVTIDISAEGVTSSPQQTLEFKDAAFKLVNLAGMAGSITERNQTIAVGGSLALNYQVVDQYGVAPTDNYAVTVTRATASGRGTSTTDAAWSLSANFSGGKASVTISDNGSGVGTDTITSKLYKVLAGGGYASSATQTDTFTLTYANAADVTATAVTAVVNNNGVKDFAAQAGALPNTATAYTASTADDVATNPLAIEAKALTAIDTRVQNTTVPAYAANNAFGVYNTGTTAAISSTANEQATLSGVVTNVAGGAVAGVPVTISGAGLLFVYTGADSAPIYAVGSITVLTGTSGDYSVSVLGQITGKAAITVTSGAATVASAVTFGSASAATIALTAPTSAQAGRAVDVVATLADKYKNIVKGTDVTFSSTGVGYLSNTAATASDSKGSVSVKLIVGAGETGDAVVTATFTNSDGDDVAVSKTITFGATDAQIDVVKNRVTAVASFSKGKTVSFYVDGSKKWSKLSASDADVVLNYNLKKGKHTVAVKISGGFTTTEVIVVK